MAHCRWSGVKSGQKSRVSAAVDLLMIEIRLAFDIWLHFQVTVNIGFSRLTWSKTMGISANSINIWRSAFSILIAQILTDLFSFWICCFLTWNGRFLRFSRNLHAHGWRLFWFLIVGSVTKAARICQQVSVKVALLKSFCNCKQIKSLNRVTNARQRLKPKTAKFWAK